MHKVGQILYSIIEDKKIIIPVQVIEEVTVKNLEFEKTTYKVKLPNKKNQKVDLDRFDKVFDELDKATQFLIENAKSAIEKISFEALELEDKFFSTSSEVEVKEVIDECNNEDTKIKIDLGDGTKASINIDEINKLNN